MSQAPYPFDLCGYTCPIQTKSPQSQLWFDRGLFQCMNFNHYEAEICFELAIKHDAECAMAHWGIAYALGVNYNKIALMEGEEVKAFKAITKAVELAKTDVGERMLCAAMAVRYEDKPFKEYDADMYHRLNHRFVKEMKVVYEASEELDRKHGTHPFRITVAFLYAEALMQTKPWGLWKDTMEETLIAKEVLENALDAHPLHPALCHLYVHLMEMSPQPQAAIPQSDVLRSTWKDFGHLLHMSSHIDMLVGRYTEAVECNRLAIEADKRFVELRGPATYYQGYLIHNYHMKSWACLYTGEFENALTAAISIEEETPRSLLEEYVQFMEPYFATKWHIFIRFGKWSEILAAALPEDPVFMVGRASGLYAKALAYAALGMVDKAEDMQASFLESLKVVGMELRQLHNVKSQDSLAVGVEMLDGEILFRKWTQSPDKKADMNILNSAMVHLRNAVEIDDSLPYDEPWGWMVPSRHALAALLIEARDLGCCETDKGCVLREAEALYRKDLKMYPKNVWSLRGLENCLRRFNNQSVYGAEISYLNAAAAQAGKHGDIPIGASCLCALGQQSAFENKETGVEAKEICCMKQSNKRLRS